MLFTTKCNSAKIVDQSLLEEGLMHDEEERRKSQQQQLEEQIKQLDEQHAKRIQEIEQLWASTVHPWHNYHIALNIA